MSNSVNKINILVIAIIACIVIYLGWYMINNLEKVENKSEPIATAEARVQPYLALSEFLKSKDYSVKQNVSWAQLDEVNPEDTVLVIPFLPQHLPLSQKQKLDRLLERGQVFIGLIPPPGFSLFGDIETETDEEGYLSSEFLERYDLSLYQEDEDNYGTSDINGRNMKFEMPNNWMLEEYTSDSDYKQWSYWTTTDEEQKLVILPEFSIFSNDRIGNRDNALLFLSLLEYDNDSKTHNKIWLLTTPITPGFFSLIWRYFSEFILGLLLLVALSVWRSSRRFGPTFSLFRKSRKELKEHLVAVGRWHWNSSKSQQLIDISFEQIHRSMKYSYHNWGSFDQHKQVQLLANHTGLPESNILKTWQHKSVNSRVDFLHLMQQLQTIRIKL